MNRNKVFEYAKEAGAALDSAALDRLELLEQQLLQWNEHMNLTAITDED